MADSDMPHCHPKTKRVVEDKLVWLGMAAEEKWLLFRPETLSRSTRVRPGKLVRGLLQSM